MERSGSIFDYIQGVKNIRPVFQILLVGMIWKGIDILLNEKERKIPLFSNCCICFSRLLDDYLVLFRKEVDDRKTWIAVSENRMSLSYIEIEDLPGFEDELKEHKVVR